MNRLLTTLTLTMASIGLASSADALTFDHHPSLEELAKEAPLSFRGVVKQVRFAQSESGSEVPYTQIVLKVERAYAGTEAGAEVTLNQIGGRLADERFVVIPGLATFDVGQSVIVMSNDRVHPFFATVYGDQGALYVRNLDGKSIVTTADGRVLVERDGAARFGGAHCLTRAGECELAPIFENKKLDPDMPIMTVDAFDAWMLEIAGAAAEGAPAQTVSASRARFEAALLRLGGAK